MIFINSYTSFPVVVQTPVEYPPPGFPMNTNSTPVSGQAYGNGTYVASASTEYNATYAAWRAFNKVITNDDHWTCSSGLYQTSGAPNAGVASTTIVGIGAVLGEWLQLMLPSSITLTGYSFTSQDYPNGTYWLREARSWRLCGSSDGGTTWNLLDTKTAQNSTAYMQVRPYTITNSTPYNRYRLIYETVQNGNDSMAQTAEFRLFGF